MGLLLVIYGVISLWAERVSSASNATSPRICEFLLCGVVSTDSPTSFTSPVDKPLKQAQLDLTLNPASAYRWADLGEAEINANKVDAARFCVRQALASAPGNPAILFRGANIYLRMEDYPAAMKNLMAVLRNPDLADYYDPVFRLYSQMDMPLTSLLNEGLPRTQPAANAFLRFWINQNRQEEAETTWTWINQNSLTSVQSAGSYVALLAKDARWDEAMQSWGDYTARLDTSYNRTNWIYNGNFEMKPVDCPFDWHFAPQDTVDIAPDNEQTYKGEVSLRLRYTGAPKEPEAQVYQMVLLKPGKWMIRGAMKTQALTGEQGVVIRVVDAEDPTQLDVSTNTFQGTQEWTGISKKFEVGAKTRLARVEIVRPPAPDLNIRLTGKVWIDAVELAPVL